MSFVSTMTCREHIEFPFPHLNKVYGKELNDHFPPNICRYSTTEGFLKVVGSSRSNRQWLYRHPEALQKYNIVQMPLWENTNCAKSTNDKKQSRNPNKNALDVQTTNFSRNELISAKREQQASKGNKRSQKGAKITEIGQAMKKRRMSPAVAKKLSVERNEKQRMMGWRKRAKRSKFIFRFNMASLLVCTISSSFDLQQRE